MGLPENAKALAGGLGPAILRPEERQMLITPESHVDAATVDRHWAEGSGSTVEHYARIAQGGDERFSVETSADGMKARFLDYKGRPETARDPAEIEDTVAEMKAAGFVRAGGHEYKAPAPRKHRKDPGLAAHTQNSFKAR